MNNGLWDDRLNHLKQKDLEREIRELHLLKEAGLEDHGLLKQIGKGLQAILHSLGRRLQERKADGQAMVEQAGKTSL